jgi:hypothetical protein
MTWTTEEEIERDNWFRLLEEERDGQLVDEYMLNESKLEAERMGQSNEVKVENIVKVSPKDEVVPVDDPPF